MSVSLEEAERLLKKAYLKEEGQDWDSAFRFYIESAQNFLQLSRDLSNQTQKERCRESASTALKRAEKIKAHKRDVKPVPDSPYSSFNQSSVLEDSARINGQRFPAWTPDSRTQFSTSQKSIEQPNLSPLQISLEATYRRPQSWTISHDLFPEELVQNSVTDCSLIASFAVCLNHDRKFGSKLLLSCMDQGASASAQLNAIHHFNFLVNGVYRHVVIDDTLPYNSKGRLLCSQALNKKDRSTTVTNIFPSLLEKAYMKLRGGYDFPGSNSGVDLHTLIGWIPDFVHIQRWDSIRGLGRILKKNSGSFAREKTWTRLVKAFKQGTCLLTLGTDAKRTEESDRNDEAYLVQHQLLESHCYAVLDVSEIDDVRTVTFLDPWQDENEDILEARRHTCSWPIICEVFDTIHISWDPGIWKHCSTVHRAWKSKDQSPKLGTNNHRISFSLSSPLPPPTAQDPTKDTIWVLLTRHMGATPSQEQSPKYIALHMAEYHTVEINSRLREHDFKGTYSDGNHVLLKLNPRSQDIGIITSLDGSPNEDVNYTLRIYSYEPITIYATKLQFLYSKSIEHNFTYQTSGGNFSSQLFMDNPQWHLKISKNGPEDESNALINLSLEGEKTMALNACIVWSPGGRIADVVKGDIAASTGEYKYGVASCTSELKGKSGDYTLIISQFTPHTLGSFLLQLNGTKPIELQLLPQEGAGMFRKVIRGQWKSGVNAGGSPKFGTYSLNPKIKIALPGTTQTRFRLRSTPSRALNVSLFNAIDEECRKEDLEQGKEVITSGAFLDAPCGVTTGLKTLRAGTYWLIPSTYVVGTEASWEMIVHHSKRDVTVEGPF